MTTPETPRFYSTIGPWRREASARPERAILKLAALAVVLAVLCAAGRADAQRAGPQDGRVRPMIRQALEAFQNLDLDLADTRLQQALRRCGRRGCSAPVLAQVYVAIGVVALGGRNDEASALESFGTALRTDPDAAIEPTLSTAAIDTLFRRARASVRGAPGTQMGHVPVEEQLSGAPVPLYVQAPGTATHVRAYYRAQGSTDWRSVELSRHGGGWGGEVPCNAVTPPAIEYYVEAVDDADAPLATAGSESSPQRIAVVTVRTRPAPFLPGRLPPNRCRAPGERSPVGESCASTDECASGLRCEQGVCTASVADPAGPPLFVLDLGIGLGLAFVDTASAGVAPAYAEERYIDPADPQMGTTCEPLACPAQLSGVSPALAFTIAARFNIGNRFGIGGAMRWQPDSASRPALSGVVFSVRGYLAITPAGFVRRGFSAAVFAGTGVGEIQARPAADATTMGMPSAHLITGLNEVHGGARFEYGVTSVLHVGVDATVHYMFPRSLVALDLSAIVGLRL